MTRGDVDIYPKRSKAPSVQELLGLTLQREDGSKYVVLRHLRTKTLFWRALRRDVTDHDLKRRTYSIIGFSDSLAKVCTALGPSLFARKLKT